MTSAEMLALLRTEHLTVTWPGGPVPQHGGWYLILTPSAYHPQGWTLRMTHPHRLLLAHVERVLVRLGMECQVDQAGLIEFWPAVR